MTHPEDLLADYVDGTLSDTERAVVDAHLDTCAACRQEVELATGAVSALASLPEEPVPLGVTGPVLVEAGARFEGRRAAAWHRLQWVAGAAAAAALVAVFVIGGLGRDGEDAAREGAVTAEADGAGEAVTAPQPQALPALEQQVDVDYDEGGVRSLAEDAAANERAADQAGTGATGAAEEAATTLASPDRAIACLREAGAPLGDPDYRMTRLVEARFERTPAYLAVFLQSPGAEQPPDHAIVWVVARNDCRILNLQSLPI